MKPSFAEVWQRIQAHAGHRFRLARGREITYTVVDDVVHIDGSDSRVHISQFQHALDLVPVTGPSVFDEASLWGPSYLYAIMMDARISCNQW